MNDDIDIGRIRKDLAEVSRRVFGKLYRLEVIAVAGALDPPLWARRLAQALGIADNQVAAELGLLVKLGALQRFPAEHDRRKIYQATKHPMWGFTRDLLDHTIRQIDPEQGEEMVARYWYAVLGHAEPQPVPR